MRRLCRRCCSAGEIWYLVMSDDVKSHAGLLVPELSERSRWESHGRGASLDVPRTPVRSLLWRRLLTEAALRALAGARRSLGRAAAAGDGTRGKERMLAGLV